MGTSEDHRRYAEQCVVMAQRSEDGGDMAMGKRAADLEGLIAGDQIFTLEDAA